MKITRNDFINLDWAKMQGLIPAVIQDASTLQVLMLGYMNQESLAETIQKNKVIFYSRSKEHLWMKGETSGNFLELVNIIPDCDQDTLLILVNPVGDACHLYKTSCFGDETAPGVGFLAKLEKLIDQRYRNRPESSYTSELFESGTQRIAQKIGEEGVEVALAAVSSNPKQIASEAADLIYHLLVLLRQCHLNLQDVLDILKTR